LAAILFCLQNDRTRPGCLEGATARRPAHGNKAAGPDGRSEYARD